MRSDTVSSMGRYAVAVVLLLVGMWVGVKFPDADLGWLRLRSFVDHRSILTHGLLIPLFLFIQYQFRAKSERYPDPLPRLALMGLLIGLSVHLSFDLFPRAWWRYALIHVPLYGWISPLYSQVWLGASLLGGLYMGCRLLRSVNELFFSLLVLVVAFVLCAQTAYAPTPLYALLTLAFFGGIAFVLPRPAVKHSDTATMPRV